jgi:hypothetical protein
MIDPVLEALVPLAQVPRLKWLPLRQHGKRIHLSTVYRWHQRGLNGVRLEAVQCGGTRCTTEAALIRFFNALGRPAQAGLVSRCRLKHLRGIDAALDAAGI